MKKLKIIGSIVLTTLLATSAVLAWVDLGTVTNGVSLTDTLWNQLIGKVNENGTKLDGIYNVGGNIGIGESSPTDFFEISKNIESSTKLKIKNISNGVGSDPGIILESINSKYTMFANDESNQLYFWDNNTNTPRMTIFGDGNVGIGISSPTVKLDVDGEINGNFEGFSYYTTGFSKLSLTWEKLLMSNLDYNSFGILTYSSGIFTAPKDGFYNFKLYGYISTAGTGNERYALGIHKNGVLVSLSGGNYSVIDTPTTVYSHNVYLNIGDIIKPMGFSAITATFGGMSTGHNFWFQGEYLGK